MIFYTEANKVSYFPVEDVTFALFFAFFFAVFYCSLSIIMQYEDLWLICFDTIGL